MTAEQKIELKFEEIENRLMGMSCYLCIFGILIVALSVLVIITLMQ